MRTLEYNSYKTIDSMDARACQILWETVVEASLGILNVHSVFYTLLHFLNYFLNLNHMPQIPFKKKTEKIQLIIIYNTKLTKQSIKAYMK